MNKKIYILIIVAALCLLLFPSCRRNFASKNLEVKEKTYFEFFDTVSHIYSFAGDSQESFENNCKQIEAILRDYNNMLDIYHEFAQYSNLCTVNRLAGTNPVKVDSRLIDFLLSAKELCVLTNGEMDISMGAVLSIWHYARTAEKPFMPDISEIQEASKHIGFDKIEIDKQNSTVRLTDLKASLDVGAIGKGYAAEQAAKYLEEHGVSGYVLNIGGNIRIVGTKPNGSGWKTGIKNPKDSKNSLVATLMLFDTSCVTSGTYERFFSVDGTTYSHIIDKDTLFPADYFDSVSVITKDSGLADCLSTALFCMPYDEGKKLVDSLDNVDCVWVFKDGSLQYTNGIEPQKL